MSAADTDSSSPIANCVGSNPRGVALAFELQPAILSTAAGTENACWLQLELGLYDSCRLRRRSYSHLCEAHSRRHCVQAAKQLDSKSTGSRRCQAQFAVTGTFSHAICTGPASLSRHTELDTELPHAAHNKHCILEQGLEP